MERKYRLVSRLYYISVGALALFTIHLAVVAGFDLFLEKPMGNFTIMPNHVTGYVMPAELQVQTFDTIIDYRREKTEAHASKHGSIFIKDGQIGGYSKSQVNSIINDPAYQKTIIIQTKRARLGARTIDAGEIKLAPGQAEASVLIKPKNIWLAIILAIRNYAVGLCILFVLFQLVRLFKRLNNNFSFSTGLSNAIYNIGISLLLYQLLLFTTGSLVSLFVDAVSYNESIAGTYGNKQTVLLHITYGNDFTILFIGLCLVALSKLLEYGSELQEENELTV